VTGDANMSLMKGETKARLHVWRAPFGGLLGALILLAASLMPSLLPRPWYLQGAVSGVAIAIGYGLGSVPGTLIRSASRGRRSPTVPRLVRLSLLLLALALLVWAAIVHFRWQVDVRRLMDMEQGVALYLLGAILAALAVGYILVVAARLTRKAWGGYVRLLQRKMSRVLGVALAIVTTLVVGVVVLDVVVGDRLFTALNEAYLASDRRFDIDVSQPDSPDQAGGPGSLIDWETMGRQGRAFVAEAPNRQQLEDFNGEAGLEPIRVYAGLQTADTAEERAEVAVAELERTGAFEREILLLVAPTGTGWIDPYAVSPLEYMYNGDTAAVAVQYSHLPSWVLMIGNQDRAVEASRAMFEAVRDRLEQLPESSRPRLLLYGESLGSFGWEVLFDDLDDVQQQTDGVLWVGPPRSNRLWSEVMSQRQQGSPVWRPVVEGGETVRFGPDGDTLAAVDGPWNPPRIVYLQHASDPITWLSIDILLDRPEWMDEPRGPDVSRYMPYVPIVTFWQLVVDLVMGTNAPLGHGHKFGSAQAEAWSLIIPPDDWSAAETRRLVDTVEEP
jgi:uncharacterized membrane protein